MKSYNEILEILEKYNQTHLLDFYNELSLEEQEKLLKNIENNDFEEISTIVKNNKSMDMVDKNNESLNSDIVPIEALDKYSISNEEWNKYKEMGEDLIKKGGVAVCTMAGGQGSRLGHEGPKGTFMVPLKEPKSIFQIAAEHIINAANKYNTPINWYIMTSEENDKVTKEFFEENNFWGYNKEYVKFFKQGQLPLTDFDGKILLQEKGKIYKAANGNGGIFKALEDNGIVEELKNKNIKYLVSCNVDNILIKPIDEIMLGVLNERSPEICIKSVIKRAPNEPVGVCCLKDGKPTVIEYIDFPKELAETRNDDGSLKFGEVHFGCNYLSTKLLEKISNEKLPYHGAKKKNKYINKAGMQVCPDTPNSFKYEMFIFDGFEKADSALVFRVKREEEFAPIKNKEGEDSPITAAKMYEGDAP